MPIILLLILVLIILGPQWWVKWIINQHQKDLDRIPGTGGELAVHLLKQLKITDVEVESTEQGDHYDPTAMKVRLSEANYSGRSLAAVAIAAGKTAPFTCADCHTGQAADFTTGHAAPTHASLRARTTRPPRVPRRRASSGRAAMYRDPSRARSAPASA